MATETQPLDAAQWACEAAQVYMDEHADAAALDTADYRICGFIHAAAKLALQDPAFAARIGQLMEPPRNP